MDIGTAKPPSFVLARYPHAGIDECDPDEDFSVADFLALVQQAQERHEHVVVVGGTPFYLRALVKPLAPLPAADPETRRELEALPDPHERLRQVDPVLAGRLHPNDRVRIIRGLEVHRLTGKPLSTIQAERTPPPCDLDMVWLDRPDLDARIDLRLHRMVQRGYAREVRGLLEAGWSRDLKPLQSFAYRHMVEHVIDGLSLEEATRRTARDTRRFARKQRTWSRSMGWSVSSAQEAMDRASSLFGA
ncbi:MAG: tRNA (adenosine(37)-N6)-dimethylallyltransferase MiaA, partial [Myxococcota bacterium]|nr:tRNA (adenosine(37)-N6)-dimethylallyltransferase MiaA [Myxococcota bacterium]